MSELTIQRTEGLKVAGLSMPNTHKGKAISLRTEGSTLLVFDCEKSILWLTLHEPRIRFIMVNNKTVIAFGGYITSDDRSFQMVRLWAE